MLSLKYSFKKLFNNERKRKKTFLREGKRLFVLKIIKWTSKRASANPLTTLGTLIPAEISKIRTILYIIQIIFSFKILLLKLSLNAKTLKNLEKSKEHFEISRLRLGQLAEA